MRDKGLIHIYCGDGKGKTTAAVGQAVRAAGRGFHVVFAQFLKWKESGEITVLRMLDHVKVLRSDKIPHKFTWALSKEEWERVTDANNALLEKAIACCHSKRSMLVLDELVGAYDKELINRKRVLDFLHNRPDGLEIILTGRNPADELIELAAYVSEINKKKHPFDQDICAREGIEF